MPKSINLRSKIITVLLIVSMTPIIIMGIGAWFVFGRLLEVKSVQLQKTVVESHAAAIDNYLSERLNSLRFIANSLEKQDIRNQNTLQDIFNNINNYSDNSFQDLGIIGIEGEHLAYIGPYDLLRCNYKNEDWFRHVLAESVYISDVFPGFRKIPHIIIAVKVIKDADTWILRATINSDKFDRIVQTVNLGETGETFIINESGLYQTAPVNGSLLDDSKLKPGDIFQGVSVDKVRVNGRSLVRVTTWLDNKDWLLVVQKRLSEVRAPVDRAIAYGGVLAILSMIIIAVANFFATTHLTSQIDRANQQREEMYQIYTRTARLASIGELATGLAHEINNPLAIISTNQTNIEDILTGIDEQKTDIKEILDSLNICKRQIERCKNITTKMLQFGRKRKPELKPTEIKPVITEIISMMELQVKAKNIEISKNIQENLPPVIIDPLELEQVIVNLIQNSFHALPKGGRIKISASYEESRVSIEVKDNGVGISQENIERIFEPFFTTKPVGEGTGLGLSVCYGIVQTWGGSIEVDSKPGKGTSVRIIIPLQNLESDINITRNSHTV